MSSFRLRKHSALGLAAACGLAATAASPSASEKADWVTIVLEFDDADPSPVAGSVVVGPSQLPLDGTGDPAYSMLGAEIPPLASGAVASPLGSDGFVAVGLHAVGNHIELDPHDGGPQFDQYRAYFFFSEQEPGADVVITLALSGVDPTDLEPVIEIEGGTLVRTRVFTGSGTWVLRNLPGSDQSTGVELGPLTLGESQQEIDFDGSFYAGYSIKGCSPCQAGHQGPDGQSGNVEFVPPLRYQSDGEERLPGSIIGGPGRWGFWWRGARNGVPSATPQYSSKGSFLVGFDVPADLAEIMKSIDGAFPGRTNDHSPQGVSKETS